MSRWHTIFTVPLYAAHISASAIAMSYAPLFPRFRVTLFTFQGAGMTIYHGKTARRLRVGRQNNKKMKVMYTE